MKNFSSLEHKIIDWFCNKSNFENVGNLLKYPYIRDFNNQTLDLDNDSFIIKPLSVEFIFADKEKLSVIKSGILSSVLQAENEIDFDSFKVLTCEGWHFKTRKDQFIIPIHDNYSCIKLINKVLLQPKKPITVFEKMQKHSTDTSLILSIIKEKLNTKSFNKETTCEDVLDWLNSEYKGEL